MRKYGRCGRHGYDTEALPTIPTDALGFLLVELRELAKQ